MNLYNSILTLILTLKLTLNLTLNLSLTLNLIFIPSLALNLNLAPYSKVKSQNLTLNFSQPSISS